MRTHLCVYVHLVYVCVRSVPVLYQDREASTDLVLHWWVTRTCSIDPYSKTYPRRLFGFILVYLILAFFSSFVFLRTFVLPAPSTYPFRATSYFLFSFGSSRQRGRWSPCGGVGRNHVLQTGSRPRTTLIEVYLLVFPTTFLFLRSVYFFLYIVHGW